LSDQKGTLFIETTTSKSNEFLHNFESKVPLNESKINEEKETENLTSSQN